MPDLRSKPVISGCPREDLIGLSLPLPPFRAKQIFKWIARGARSFSDMTNLSLDLRRELDSRFTLYGSRIAARLEDPDGTVKLQIALADGARIEAVLLHDGQGRRTACLSTQAGCPAGCVFCKTGTLGFLRNLDSAEIVEQFLHIRSVYPAIANIVIMGMGEPLLNLTELRRALLVLTDQEGLGLSRRRITVSTSGIVEGIRDLADRGPPVRLAVSLPTAEPCLREALMPISRGNPLPALKEALVYYQRKQDRRITVEAVLLGGLNTRQEDAAALAAFAAGLDVVVNLIPWNPVEGPEFRGLPLREPARGELERFMGLLNKKGLKVTRRFRKGRGVSGACGQLGVCGASPLQNP
ncbi:MAG: 23S rRNA (adenine(2503)-C(2))-methyltransferase RlmN [Spirochaetaceae bacterium]|jgi:23S rRNA (adenine2503-C2)-methyltransferase|nr:23S rRNA (adenine(2503)-C(2))-methyltransferase RlmN [Spirochaetaceae bacterium]